MNKVSRLIKSCRTGQGRAVASNFGWLMVLQIVNYALPLVTLPYLAHVIGVTGFGKLSFAAAVIVWFQAISDWGFNFTATRDVARNRNDLAKVSEIFSNVLFARFAIMIAGFAVLLILIASIKVFNENSTVLLLSYLMIPGHIICPDWFFQGMERMKYTTILNVLAKLSFTALVFVFIKNENDYILQPIFTSLGYLAAGVISFWIIIFRWHIHIVRPDFAKIRKTIVSSTDIFINSFVPNLYNSLSIVLMGFWGGAVANGLYDAGSKFINIIIQFMNTLSRAFFPFLSREIRHHHKYAVLNMMIVCACALVLYVGAPLLMSIFFTPAFDRGIVVTRILAVALPFMALSNIYGTNYLILTNGEKKLRNATLIASLTGFCAAIPLVYYFSYIGAAVTVAFSRSLLGLMVFATAKRQSAQLSQS